MGFVEVPIDRINEETLEVLVEEFVTRAGTDYGDKEHALETKKSAVIDQIRRGDAAIVFDPKSETCNIVLKEELRLL